MAVTETWNIPVLVKVHERVATPDPVRETGEMVQLVLFVERFTSPENPLRAATVLVEEA